MSGTLTHEEALQLAAELRRIHAYLGSYSSMAFEDTFFVETASQLERIAAKIEEKNSPPQAALWRGSDGAAMYLQIPGEETTVAVYVSAGYAERETPYEVRLYHGDLPSAFGTVVDI